MPPDLMGDTKNVKASDPTGDAAARALFHQISDGTNGPVSVKNAAAAALTDKALVVAE